MAIDKSETEQYRSAKDQGCGDQSREELPCDQQLTPHGRQKVIMQAFFYDLTAEQPGEEPHTAKEYSDTQIENLKRVSQHPRVFFNAAIPTHWAGKSMDTKHHGGSKGQQINPNAATHP